MCGSRRLERAHSASRRRAWQPFARSRLILHTRPDDHRAVECHASASALHHTGRMQHPTPLPVGLGAPAFSVAAARRAGVSRARLRASDLRRPHYGVRLTGSDDSLASRTQAYAQRMPSNHHFSHLTAARVNGMRMPDGFRDGKLHVTAVGGGRAPRGANIIGHKAQTADIAPTPTGQPHVSVQVSHGLPLRVSTPVATWLDLGGTLSVRDLVIMGDGLVSKRRPAATMHDLRAAVTSRKGRRGYRALCDALKLIRPRTDSARETILRLMILEAGLPEPEIDVKIVNRFGAEIANTDLGYRQYRVLIEYDGGQHREDPWQFGVDIERLDNLMEERWRVIRVDKMLMAKMATLIGKITTALMAGGWRGPGQTDSARPSG